jgi:hypothetical protein
MFFSASQGVRTCGADAGVELVAQKLFQPAEADHVLQRMAGLFKLDHVFA